jgi:hypothetical protein
LFGSRHVFAVMGFLGLASVYMMRIKLSVAIVDIVKTGPSVDNATSFFGRSGGTSASNNSAQCEDQGSKSNEVCIRFEVCPLINLVNSKQNYINTEQRRVRLGRRNPRAFGGLIWEPFSGAKWWQIPGGILAEKYGGKYVFAPRLIFMELFFK